MRSKISFFKVSLSLVKEDFRRFWAIPVLAFAGYFLSGIFYILMNYDSITESKGKGTYLALFIENVLSGEYFVYSAIMFAVPILSAVLIFKYLHSSGHVMSVHSQPFTRNILLNSHALSCLLFAVLPIILTGLILLVMAQPTYYPKDYYYDSSQMENVFARVKVLQWMWESIIISAFILAVSLIGTMATGTTLHNALASIGFNLVLPGCVCISVFYFQKYLFGYTVSDSFIENVSYLSPVAATYATENFSVLISVVYVIVIIALYAFSMFLYNKRKLERASDGVVFKAFDVFITLVFGYVGMTGLGAVFYSMFNYSEAVTVFGYIVGALLSMIICRMVVMKTIKIFTKESIKIMASYVIFAVIFIIVIVCDITGFEKRIPDNAGGVWVNYSTDDPIASSCYFDDEEDIEIVNRLHKFIVENKDLCYENNNGVYVSDGDYNRYIGSDDYVRVRIAYYKDSKGSDTDDGDLILERRYNVPAYLLISSDEYKDYLDSESVRNFALGGIPSAESMVSAQINYGYMTNGAEITTTIADKAQAEALRNAIEEDIVNTTSDELLENYKRQTIATINLQYNRKIDTDVNASVSLEGDHHVYKDGYMGSTSNILQTVDLSQTDWGIKDCYKNTIAWLEANGYGDLIKLNNDTLKFAAIYNVNENWYDNYNVDFESIPESKEGMVVVTDFAQIEQLYRDTRAHDVFGPIRDLTTADDDIYAVIFYRNDDYEEGYTQDYGAYIKGDKLTPDQRP